MKENREVNSISQKEKEILKFWQANKIFEKTLAATKDGKTFSFYDGPPFANGLPHYGHLLAGLMKDVIPRYQTMRGRFVHRRWGWDCHGLPVESLIEQELGLQDKKDIEKIGVAKFNQACRESVLRYTNEWRKTVERVGRWVDMDHDYKTMDRDYMESIWWVFKQLWDKKLIYQGYKSMHICPRCGTTLSNFEVTQNYQEIKDLSVIAKFELRDEPGTFILAWTTTPWTLPGNVALALGQDVDYVKVALGEEKYILARANVEKIFANKNYQIINSVKAKDLIGKKYQPLFDYFAAADLTNSENLYTIQLADFVQIADGTGVVHIAPAFGEDDLNLGQAKNLPLIQHVDPSGRFIAAVRDWPGELVKPKGDPQKMDKNLVDYLAKRGLVFASEEFSHSYPFCWRCDTPLLNYATTSWFVQVTAFKKDLIKNNQKIHWVPGHLKDGRFGKWLADAKDWAISRNRYWGTPLPVWQNAAGEQICVGSVKELEELTGQDIDDLHKPMIDDVVIKKDGQEFRRVPEVFDCWFESGSMPYAQLHYPFANQKEFKQNFPADFIGEGIDQTRGWFYTLLVLSTALFNQPAYYHVVANGIVLAEDGAKMAKKLNNYPEPGLIMDQYGADALRFYLLASPVLMAENLNFSEQGVKETFQKVIMILNNILSFYQLYAVSGQTAPEKLKLDPDQYLDRWLVARLNQLIQEVTQALDDYFLPKAVRPIQEFIDEFSTWWLRRSRERFKSGDQAEKEKALLVFRHVLLTLAKVMAPFTPFMAEEIYQKAGGEAESVHLASWPAVEKKMIEEKLLDQMKQVRCLAEAGLAARAEHGLKIRQPLAAVKIKQKPGALPDGLLAILRDELNVQAVVAAPDLAEELVLDTNLTEELKLAGLARELIRLVNSLRKKQGLTIGDFVNLHWQSQSEPLRQILTDEYWSAEIKKAIICRELIKADNQGQEFSVNQEKIKLEIKK